MSVENKWNTKRTRRSQAYLTTVQISGSMTVFLKDLIANVRRAEQEIVSVQSMDVLFVAYRICIGKVLMVH